MNLKIATSKRTGKTYLSIVQSYRKNGKPTTKTIESLGCLDDLKKEYNDPIKHFKEECLRRNEEQRLRNAPITLDFYLNEKISRKSSQQISVGAAIILRYMSELGIEQFFENRRKGWKFSYNPCRILELLVWMHISTPGSKRSAFNKRDIFPSKCDFSLVDVYRSLGYLDKVSERLVDFMNDSLSKFEHPLRS